MNLVIVDLMVVFRPWQNRKVLSGLNSGLYFY